MSEQGNIKVEEVGAATQPPRARVEDAEASAHKPDYLEGFLQQKPTPLSTDEPGGDVYEGVIASLKEIYDPEIPVNIYDLGLIYGVDVEADAHVVVTMTLTTPHCPVAESMPGEVEMRVGAVPGVGSAEVNLVWDPPWDPQKMSDEAKLELGML
jgi:FeS assembly SUF system protein